jgi:cytoskeletal protein CcmA (bactofilin family)
MLRLAVGDSEMSASNATGFRPDQQNAAYIGAGVTVKGDVSAPEALVVDGRIEGDVAARAVVVGPSGEIRGKVNAVEADIGGAVAGEVHITRLLAIRTTGRVEGRVSYGEIALERGGVLKGELSSSEEARTGVAATRTPPAIVTPRARPLRLQLRRK